MNSILFSSKSDLWETPKDLFDSLNAEFHFDLDPCSTDFNCKCVNHYTALDDGLSKRWSCSCAFVNPPYSHVKDWVKKCFENQKNLVCRSVLLVPSRTDTSWFHDYIYNNPFCEIRFLRGRLKFGCSKNSAPFPSMVVVFNLPLELWK